MAARMWIFRTACLAGLLLLAVTAWAAEEEDGFQPLFPEDGVPQGWMVRQWNDVSKPAGSDVQWTVKDGVLHGSESRGTWLVSEKEYGDFVLEFEWKLAERGNSGCGLRFPLKGDPAFDGIELQMVDPGYYDGAEMPAAELTGGLYRAVAPEAQLYKPGDWNQYRITCRGAQITVQLNGKQILDVNLDEQTEPVRRHNGSPAPPLKERPRRGHIGFQELSRNGQVQIRNARLKTL